MNISSYCVYRFRVGKVRFKLVTWHFRHLSALLRPNILGPMVIRSLCVLLHANPCPFYFSFLMFMLMFMFKFMFIFPCVSSSSSLFLSPSFSSLYLFPILALSVSHPLSLLLSLSPLSTFLCFFFTLFLALRFSFHVSPFRLSSASLPLSFSPFLFIDWFHHEKYEIL
jgi:hypothetical protein